VVVELVSFVPITSVSNVDAVYISRIDLHQKHTQPSKERQKNDLSQQRKNKMEKKVGLGSSKQVVESLLPRQVGKKEKENAKAGGGGRQGHMVWERGKLAKHGPCCRAVKVD
jgi:hypothetical protein